MKNLFYVLFLINKNETQNVDPHHIHTHIYVSDHK